MNAGLKLALRDVRARTRVGARSFYLASHLLDGSRRAAAYALYAFLRTADDAADDPGSPHERLSRLTRAADSLDRAFRGSPESQLEVALAWAVRQFQLPRAAIEELLRAVATDVGRVRLATWDELERYCYGVASTVGLAMAPLLGAPAGFEERAASLGRAMQLTNILRDVREDLARDRVYLPAEALRRHGLGEGDLIAGRVDPRWQALAGELAQRARAAYDAAEPGIRAIAPVRSRATVRLMRATYREILMEIERRQFDVFRERVVVSTPRKLWLAAQVVVGRDPAAPVAACSQIFAESAV